MGLVFSLLRRKTVPSFGKGFTRLNTFLAGGLFLKLKMALTVGFGMMSGLYLLGLLSMISSEWPHSLMLVWLSALMKGSGSLTSKGLYPLLNMIDGWNLETF